MVERMSLSTPQRAARAALVVTSLVFAWFGVAFLLDPGGMLEPLEIQVTTALATTEIQAMYGGLQLGAAVFFMLTAVRTPLLEAGLLAEVTLVGTLGLTRLIAVLMNGVTDSGLLLGFVGLELGSALLSAGLLIWLRRASAGVLEPDAQ